jgi:hypothetical protein
MPILNKNFVKYVPACLALSYLVPVRGADSANSGGGAKATASATATVTAYPLPPVKLPGRGLAQHDVLYTGEWDTRKTNCTLFLIQGGKVTWSYQIPRKDEFNQQESEYSDVHRLSNGDIVFAYKTGWRKISKEGKTIYDFRCPRDTAPNGSNYWRECHSAQPIGMDKVLFMLNGAPAKLCLYNMKTGKTEMEHEMRTKNPGDARSVHGQFRNVRMTKAGTYLIAHMDLGKVIEYDKEWKEIWSCDAPSVWHTCRLKNGNTLFAGNQHAFAREVNPAGEIIWELKNGDIPGVRINSVHQAIRLANGNTVICNWTAGVKKEDWAKIVQVLEVTPAKELVWAFNEWSEPDLGPASCIQLLDEQGKDEEQELMR